MNFEQMRQACRAFDEIMPIGRTVELEGKAYHIAGMTRLGKQAQMYVIEGAPKQKNDSADGHSEAMRQKESHTNRAGIKIVPAECLFSNIMTVKLGDWELETCGADSGPLALNEGCMVDADSENFLMFYEMIRAGWKLPQNSPFQTMDWKNIWWTRMSFHTEAESLPVWKDQDISIKWGRRVKPHYVEKPVCLTVGEAMEFSFAIEDGRQGICYINRVYPMDIWKENEEKFKNPRYLEIMSAEELEEHKEEFFQNLEQACPKGMCYLGIEYECTLAGSLAFYDRDFLESEPKVYRGSSSFMMMLLRPDEPTGRHGLPQRGCIIQKPIAPDVQRMDAELFRFDEMFDEGKDFVRLTEVSG
ncbi:MAG: hypothetical protein NC341_13785 [Blautia sp.]|nr:hypothetical protein [Blautia sp.]MCM1200153.1 hypothetical protein [Bacteroides fragilis]